MDLLSFTTEKIRVTIRGNPGSCLYHNSGEAEDASIQVFAQDQGELTYQDGTKEANASIQAKQRLFINTQPLFFEYQSYEMIIENESGKVLEFWHQSTLIRDKIKPLGRSGKLFTGVINFAGEIGYSDFEILLDGKRYLKLTIEIFPTKISYRKDYNELMMDVTNEVYELAFDFIKRTYQGASLNQKQNKDATVFYSILRQLYDPFIQALDQLMLRPHHQLHKVSEVVPANKVKRTNRDTIKWLRKNQQEIISKDGGYCINRALTVKKEITYDTMENRFVKFIVCAIRQRILNVKNHYEKLARTTDTALLNTLQGMIRGIDARLHTDFLNQVGEFDSRSSMSLVFMMAPAYRSLYHYYLMLNQGLSLTGDLFQISTKDLPTLYEYWCFIKLNAILKTKYDLKAQNIVKVHKNRLFVTLKKGAESRVRYLNPRNGEELILAYNPKSHALPTVTQKPDNVLTLKKKENGLAYKYIFDAKYRINPALSGSAYQQIYQNPGPQEDDINTMHRYRDAVVYETTGSHQYQQGMFGAYILFPYHNEAEYQDHRFYKSIETVNIGGLPFLPSATGLVEKQLAELIDESAESAFERALLPIGIENKLKQVDFSHRDVLVGVVKDDKQLAANLSHCFYHIPKKSVAEKRFPIHTIALYQPIGAFGKKQSGICYYGEVVSYETIKREQITEIPSKRNGAEIYYKFTVREWVQLSKPIKPKEIGPLVNTYTNRYLLENATHVSELYIKTEEEYRLYYELKRITDITIEEQNSEVQGFLFGDNSVVIRDGKIHLFAEDGRELVFEVGEFRKRPREVIGGLWKIFT